MTELQDIPHQSGADRAAAARLAARALDFYGMGEAPKAEALCRRALDLDPALVPALLLLARTALESGNAAESEAFLQRAIALEPENIEAAREYAGLLLDQGRAREAALALPDDADNLLAAGRILEEAGHVREALDLAEKAARLAPGDPEAWARLGLLLQATSASSDLAENAYRKALALRPGWPAALANLGALYAGRHDFAAARDVWSRSEDPALAVKSALALTPIPESADDIAAQRERIMRLAADPPEGAIDDPANRIGMANFFTAYHDQDNRELHAAIARLHLALCPKLGREFVQPGLSGAPKRIGVISRNLGAHTVGDYFTGLFLALQEMGLGLTFFTFDRAPNPVLALLAEKAAGVRVLPSSLWPAAEAVAEERLDLLLYCDLGMDPLTYFLSFSRLAPLQCALYGHPDEPGVPALDIFLSPAVMEPKDARAHYRERLAALPGLLSGLLRPGAPPALSRKDLNLPENRTLYLCPQSLFKLHPGYDPLFREIPRRDPDGLLLLFRSKNPAWDARIEARLGLGDRLVWLPQTSAARFLSVCRAADAVLDPPAFSGGATSYKLLGTGVPIVAFDGKFMRSRQTAGLYRHLGLEGLTAASAEEYVEIALRLAHDQAFKREAEAAVVEGADRLFQTASFAAPLKEFLENPF